MIILLSGDDTHTSYQKLTTLRERFGEQYGAYSITSLQESELRDAATLRSAVTAVPLMGTKRMVIVHDLLGSAPSKDLGTELAAVLPQVPDETVLIFYESGKIADTKSLLALALKEHARSEVSNVLTPAALESWIANYVQHQGATIARDAAIRLVQDIGPDLTRMTNELNKLITHAGAGAEVTMTHVTALTKRAGTSDVFRLIDAIGRHDSALAVRELSALRSQGEHALYLLKMIAYQMRNLVQARDILTRGGTSTDLARETRMHPYAAEKATRQAATYSLAQLTRAYELLVQTDRAIKSGRIEPDTALDRLVIALSAPLTVT